MKNTYVPTVFGKNNLKFVEKDDITIENSDDYFNRIRKEIEDRLGELSKKRAVLVVFESKEKLLKFYASDALMSIKDRVSCLTEEASLDEKGNLIKRATVSGQITLATRMFGRGTDFVCHDQTVAKNGGTHVIQTFLSEELAEEKQIKGRTARQGDQGSYSMVFLDTDLEKYQIEKTDIEDVRKGKAVIVRMTDSKSVLDPLAKTKIFDSVYDLLHDRRTDFFKTEYAANVKYVQQSKERHQASQEFLANLYSGDVNLIRRFLVGENKGVDGSFESRTVCLMDATGSMHKLLYNCKNAVNIMFKRAFQILKDHQIKPDSFQVQFSVYRNYNSREDKILQTSPWETRPHNLRTFMNAIESEGGWHNEAVELGLWHANKEHERETITQVILIGDAVPNTRKEVINKRKSFGEDYWKKTKFQTATYYEDELAKLISNNIPVHAFFVDQRAQEKFCEIATKSGGKCKELDINSNSGIDILTDLVTEEILNNVGGEFRGNDLVKAYRNKFGKSYSGIAELPLSKGEPSKPNTSLTVSSNLPLSTDLNNPDHIFPLYDTVDQFAARNDQK